jgi:NTE family protein
LVLGGGGPTGRAYELGVLKGLRDAGVDLTNAELIVGTSAGAVLGTQIRAGMGLDGLYDALPEGPSAQATASNDPGFDLAYMQQTVQMINGATEVTPDLRIAVGKRAVAAPKAQSEDAHLRFISTDLGGVVHAWPVQPLRIAAGDLSDGTIRFFDRSQEVPIERTLAATTAVPGRVAPITIGDRSYMDGFVGGPCPGGCWPNLDGAAGYVVIVVVTTGSGPQMTSQIEQLRSQGTKVVVIAPDASAASARGQDPFDLRHARPAAAAGLQQARTVATEVSGAWDGKPNL